VQRPITRWSEVGGEPGEHAAMVARVPAPGIIRSR